MKDRPIVVIIEALSPIKLSDIREYVEGLDGPDFKIQQVKAQVVQSPKESKEI